MSAYLRPTAPIAPDALLPSDPGLALELAQELLDAPRMSNHNHGLWGYHGNTSAGRSLTIQATGIGGPSAAVVLRELHEHGVSRAIRLGVCAPLGAGLGAGDVLVVDRALAADGTSAALGAEGSVQGDRALTRSLIVAAGPGARTGTVASTDLLEDGRGARDGAIATDLESAAVLALGEALGIAVAAILVVANPDSDGLPEADAGGGLGRIASAALAGDQRSGARR